MALPAMRPVAAPMAAPGPAAPAAAPMAAPAAAPKAVPATALPTALFEAATPGGTPPVCDAAYCRQPKSSCWNASKLFPCPGTAITEGPGGGATAQALRATALVGMSRVRMRRME